MTKAPSSLQELRRRIYRKAKSDETHRFWGLFVHITKMETLEEAFRIAKRNGGAPGKKVRLGRNANTWSPDCANG
jgi:RNA-directed DNA polymerase